MRRNGKKLPPRFVKLGALSAVLLLAAAFVFLLPLITKTFPARESRTFSYAPTYLTVAQLDAGALETITVSHADGERYTLVCQDGILSLQTEGGALEAISAAVSDRFIKYATTIYVEDTITSDAGELLDELPAMGLEPPQITATAAFADGSEISIFLGDTMLDTTYHYYRWSGDNSVYLCNTGVYETFEYTADMLRSVTQPVIVPSLVERVAIRRGDAVPVVCALETDAEGTVRGTLQSPYVYPMDSSAAGDLLAAVKNFRLGARLRPLTAETLSTYGFDAPQAVVTIEQQRGLYSQIGANGALQSEIVEPSSVTLTLGNADGEFFYYCAYEGTCYRVSGFLVGAFLNADAAAFATRNPADLGDVAYRSVSLQTGDGALDICAEYIETVLPNNELETDEDGNVVYTVQVSCNGSAVSAGAFEGLVARLRQMTVSGTLEGVRELAGAPRWQMTLTTAQGDTRTLAAYPADAFHDALAVDGVALHYISDEALEIALGEFTALLSPMENP